MFRAAVFTALAVASSASSAQATPDEDRTTYYARCMVTASFLATSDDTTLKGAGGLTLFFYAGHIFGANPDIDLKTVHLREAIALANSPEELRALAVQCGTEMGKRSEQLQEAGKAMKDFATSRPSQHPSRP